MEKITGFTKQLQQLAEKFRINDDLNAQIEMQDILQCMTSDPDVLIASNTNVIGTILESIYKCQNNSDWLGLADYLDHDLVRAMNS